MTRFPLALLLTAVFSSCLLAAPETGDQTPQKETETNKVEAKPSDDTQKPEEEFLHKHPTLVKMWKHSNEIRARYQLHAQRISPELTKAAQDHAWYMARTGQFSHSVNGGFVARARRHAYPGSPYGEIILYGANGISDTFNGWLNSPGHRAILLSGAREVGYGYAVGRDGRTYWVGVFGN
ncbi:CAP domain-containing protein [Bremerella cremea]|uniref:CAP domain-containing protein n=1 Tax=Bremerella cremea TaxID=1031537 RepID=A0A368KVN9_9BACT|nr:CAP domain-containing protein [Bremerella cremea]RCS54381.1 CAP domain-containing protein [Bremerella cremea]